MWTFVTCFKLLVMIPCSYYWLKSWWSYYGLVFGQDDDDEVFSYSLVSHLLFKMMIDLLLFPFIGSSCFVSRSIHSPTHRSELIEGNSLILNWPKNHPFYDSTTFHRGSNHRVLHIIEHESSDHVSSYCAGYSKAAEKWPDAQPNLTLFIPTSPLTSSTWRPRNMAEWPHDETCSDDSCSMIWSTRWFEPRWNGTFPHFMIHPFSHSPGFN